MEIHLDPQWLRTILRKNHLAAKIQSFDVLTFLHIGLPGVIVFSDNMEEFKDGVISSL